MKRAHAWIFAPTLAACGLGVANAGVIIGGTINNGNMDATSVSSQILATPTGWVATADNTDGLSSETWNNVADPGGSGVFFKSFFGDVTIPFDASIYQDNPASPGIEYTLTAWVGAGPGYSGTMVGSTTRTELAIEFFDITNGLVGSSVLNLGPAELNTVTGLPFDYDDYTVTATAPFDAATVRVRFSMIDAYDVPEGGDAALVTDHYTLIAIPEPTTFLLFAFGLLGLIRIRGRR
jgi:PEP-CTERM motif